MRGLISLTDAALRLGIKPIKLSNLLWRRELDVDRCPLLGRKRFIPTAYLAEIRRYLKTHGRDAKKRIKSSAAKRKFTGTF